MNPAQNPYRLAANRHGKALPLPLVAQGMDDVAPIGIVRTAYREKYAEQLA